MFAEHPGDYYNVRGEQWCSSPGGNVSRSLNKVMLIGNLGADPEVRSTTGGNRVATFSLATSRTWNGPSGDRQEKTEWHRCVVWNTKTSQLADIVERYLKKGDKVYVEGRIEYRQWQDKEGQTRYSTEINVREPLIAFPHSIRVALFVSASSLSFASWPPLSPSFPFRRSRPRSSFPFSPFSV